MLGSSLGGLSVFRLSLSPENRIILNITVLLWTHLPQAPMRQFQAKHVLLTYAQCGELDPFKVVSHLGDLGAECIIGRENHADGGVHLHCFATFEEKFRTRNPRWADVEGCHPNCQPCKTTPEKMYDYAIKDGEVVAGGLERPSGIRDGENDSKWGRILLASTRDEFFALVKELDPRSLGYAHSSVMRCADWLFPPLRESYVTPTGITFDTTNFPELEQWVQTHLRESVVGKLKSGHIYPRVFERRGASRRRDPWRSRMPPGGPQDPPLLPASRAGTPPVFA